jgi:hypothetical protein
VRGTNCLFLEVLARPWIGKMRFSATFKPQGRRSVL